MKKPLVSVIVFTFNQEKYIAQALDSILCQKTDFDYEILVHDDASTDSTPDIILSYYEKHNDAIVPILEKQNQYSQHVPLDKTVTKYIKGDFIAFLEGDDYWIDDYKLQKQVNFLLANDSYTACVHVTKSFDEKNKDTIQYNDQRCDRSISVEDIFLAEKGTAIGLNSLMLRAEYNQMPDMFYPIYPRGGEDLKLMWLLLSGGVYKMSDCMSAHRLYSEGSYNTKQLEMSRRKQRYYRYQQVLATT